MDETTLVLLDDLPYFSQLALRKPVIASQLDPRLEPEFGLAIGTVDMDVHAFLLAGEEEEPEAIGTQYGWAHRGSLGKARPL
jgi:hypothetical protein